jgi:membrane-bound lytic murein transglycosylase MltF
LDLGFPDRERIGEYDHRRGVGAAVGKQEDCMISARMRTFLKGRWDPAITLAGLCVLLCACSGPGAGSGPAETAAPPAGASPEAPETVADIDDPWLRPGRVAEWTGDLDGMIERGFIRVLTTATRTAYFVDGARERGIVAETADALEEMVNKRVGKGDAVRVVVVPVRRDQLIPMLLKGLGDVAIGNLTVTPERQERVDFSPPFVSDVREVVVTAPGEDPVATVEDLAGRRIWVRPSSSYHESLRALNRRFASEGRDPIDVRAADENLADEGLLEMVQAGLYPATVVDSHKLDWVWAKVFPKLGISEVAVREKGEVAAAFRKDSPRLQALLTEFCQQHRVGTAFGNTVVKRYYRQSRWIHNAASTDERRKYAAVVDLFRKYSDQYEFDHLMMIAQGYQESRLEPDARSHVGAIGIMQVMPETAAGHPIRMKNVEAPEDNIHAGVKYMRYVVDEYFDEPGIDDVNRHLFAFAAYNAGPNRIARLRKLAPEYGVDPNVWFKNVERIVASKVGREPIRYVGNIYKYYLAYRRLREIEKERASQSTG